jgi:lysophospholipase L1-like esterase
MRIYFALLLALLCPITRAATNSGTSKWEKEIGAFEASDRTNPPPKGAVVFIGSSSIRFWSSLAHDFAPIPVVNRGFGGSQTSDATAFADRIVLPYKPKAVVFYSGDNDLASGKSPETVITDFKAFVGKVRAGQPGIPIVLICVKPSPSRWALKDKVVATNKLLHNFCEQSKDLYYVDVFTPMLGANGKPNPELFRDDKLHMKPKGYEIWTSLLQPILKGIASR